MTTTENQKALAAHDLVTGRDPQVRIRIDQERAEKKRKLSPANRQPLNVRKRLLAAKVRKAGAKTAAGIAAGR